MVTAAGAAAFDPINIRRELNKWPNGLLHGRMEVERVIGEHTFKRAEEVDRVGG